MRDPLTVAKDTLASARETLHKYYSLDPAQDTPTQAQGRAMVTREIRGAELAIKRAESAALPVRERPAIWPKCGHERVSSDTIKGGPKSYPSGRCGECERERCRRYYGQRTAAVLDQQAHYRGTVLGALVGIRKNAKRRGMR
jgi:hypothetical protein